MTQHEHLKLWKLRKPKVNNCLPQRENRFKQKYNNARNQTTDNNNRVQKSLKLDKLLEIGQKILVKNHQIELDKSKKNYKSWNMDQTQRQLRSPKKNHETTPQSNKKSSTKKVEHRNNLVDYQPVEQTKPELTLGYCFNSSNADNFRET